MAFTDVFLEGEISSTVVRLSETVDWDRFRGYTVGGAPLKRRSCSLELETFAGPNESRPYFISEEAKLLVGA